MFGTGTMVKHILFLVAIVACHPGGGEAQRPDPPAQQLEATPAAYASFFNGVKRQVAQIWAPHLVWRRIDPTGTRYGTKTRVTKVRVSLSRTGDLADILLLSPSGSNELDEEAIRAFRVAAPFRNPPEGLFQNDNLLTFSFSLYFEPTVKTPTTPIVSPPAQTPATPTPDPP